MPAGGEGRGQRGLGGGGGIRCAPGQAVAGKQRLRRSTHHATSRGPGPWPGQTRPSRPAARSSSRTALAGHRQAARRSTGRSTGRRLCHGRRAHPNSACGGQCPECDRGRGWGRFSTDKERGGGGWMMWDSTSLQGGVEGGG